MGILSGLFRSRDKPTDSTAGSAWRFYFGNSSSNKLVSERSAMQVAAVYACVRVLAEAVAQLPLHLYRYTGEGSKEKAADHPLYFLLHDEPNPEMSSFVLNFVGLYFFNFRKCHRLLYLFQRKTEPSGPAFRTAVCLILRGSSYG